MFLVRLFVYIAFLFVSSCSNKKQPCGGELSIICSSLPVLMNSLNNFSSSNSSSSESSTNSNSGESSTGNSNSSQASGSNSSGSGSGSQSQTSTSNSINCSNLSSSTTATSVLGQGGVFNTGTANKGGRSAESLNGPFSIAIDSNGNVFVSDTANNRVLMFPEGATTATVVYGQNGNFTTGNNGTSSSTLKNQIGVHIDSSDNLYIADLNNNRVLFFQKNSTAPTRVYGQTNYTSATAGTTSTGLTQPRFMITDSSNNLYVSDSTNARVLFYPNGSTTATRVYGQTDDLTSNMVNKGGLSANSLSSGIDGLALDNSGNLYVSDTSNRRILFFLNGSNTATRVYGQGGVYDTNTVNKGGRSANSIGNPFHILIDRCNNLLVADNGNSRILVYPSGSTTANKVYGQNGSFTTAVSNTGSNATADSFGSISGIALDNRPGGKLYVTDYSNHRVTIFPYY